MKWPTWLRRRPQGASQPPPTTSTAWRVDRRIVSPEGRQRYDAWQREKKEVEKRLEIIDAQTQILLRIMARSR